MDSELDLLGAGLGPEPVIRAAAVVAGVVARGFGELQHRRAASRLLHSCASRQLPVSPAPAQLRGGAAAKIFVNMQKIFACSSVSPAGQHGAGDGGGLALGHHQHRPGRGQCHYRLH